MTLRALPATPDARSFRVEWHRSTAVWRRPALEGFVYNDSPYRVGDVKLRIVALDGADQVVGETFAWVYGNIPARGRWSFSIPLPRGGEAFRITVESFHLVAIESP
ncbi:MAG: FxLYD domain-containing protein [Candidatus Rokuibacteriota bacterium]